MYYIQNRWKYENNSLYYYGLRNKDDLFNNRIKLTGKQREIILCLPKKLNDKEKKTLCNLIGKQIVKEDELTYIPRRLSEATFCKTCSANNFIIPGLEFDDDGNCPMCQTGNEVRNLKSILPLVDEIPHSKKSRFDIALFYTGGKDSTYMLYYLSKVKRLRVLALTWVIPFMSDSAKNSIANAKERFSNVEFIERTVSNEDLKKIYRKLYSLSGNTCACPSLAYLLFYPELVNSRVPYFVAGNEPVQMLGLYYNHMAPKLAYSFSENRLLAFLINAVKIVTLRPPLKKGQLQTLVTMKQLAYGDSFIKRISGYENELVSNVVTAIHEVLEIITSLKKSIKNSSRTGHISAFVHLDLNKICGGVYDWNKVKDILITECGWIPPDEENKALHTSCRIEKCKDYTQFFRFYNCQSKLIPFSAIEISLASRNCGKTREETIEEMKDFLGFSISEIPECQIMRKYLGDAE